MALCSEGKGRTRYAAVCDATDCEKEEILGVFDDFDAARKEAKERGWGEGWVDLGIGGAKVMGLFCPNHAPQ